MRISFLIVLTLVTVLVVPRLVIGSELIDAISKNQAEGAKNLIGQNRLDLEEKDGQGNTALIAAVLAGQPEVVRLLLQRGARVAAVNNDGFNALHLCAHYSSLYPVPKWLAQRLYDCARALLEYGADPDMPTDGPSRRTALMLATEGNADDLIRLLIKHGASTEKTDASGKTALQNTVVRSTTTFQEVGNRCNSVRALINGGANVNVQDPSGKTPLILLAQQEDHDRSEESQEVVVTTLLLRAGAKLETSDKSGKTAIIYAETNGKEDLEALLAAAGADTAAFNYPRLISALRLGDVREVQRLVKAVDLRHEPAGEEATLIVAVRRRIPASVKILIDEGANVNARAEDGKTVLMIACDPDDGRGSSEIVSLLIEAGADVNAADLHNQTALCYAGLLRGFAVLPTVKLLVNAGADLDVKYGRDTLLSVAIGRKDVKLTTLLLDKGAHADSSLTRNAERLLEERQAENQRAAHSVPANLKQFRVSIKRGGCDGGCPVYNAVIDASGNVEYTGHFQVSIFGIHRYRISTDKVRAIAGEIIAAGFYDCNEVPPRINVSDVAVYVLEAEINGASRSLSNYATCTNLDALLAKIEELSELKNWIWADAEFVRSHRNDPGFLSGSDAGKSLVFAINMGEAQTAKALLEAGVEPNATDDSGTTALAHAAARGDMEMVELLLKWGARMGPAEVEYVLKTGDPWILKYLFRQGARVEHSLALHEAAQQASSKTLKALIAAGAPVDARDEEGNTPLLVAAGHRNYSAVLALLGAGATTDVKNKQGETPLVATVGDLGYSGAKWYAEDRDALEIVKALLKAGAKTDVISAGHTPLLTAVLKRDYYIAQALLEAGADPNFSDPDAASPLATAESERFTEISDLLETADKR